MKIFKILIFFSFLYFKSFAQRNIKYSTSGANLYFVASSAPICNDFKNDLQLAWSDEFNSSTLDLSKWQPSLPWGLANSDGGDTWCDINEIHHTGTSIKFGCNYNPNNVDLDGTMVYKPYSIGVISSLEHFKYGYYEMRCKVPRISKHWPAFWLFGHCSQEIDIFEFTGNEHISASQTLGSEHYNLSSCSPYRPKWYIPQECASANPIMTYHSPKSPCEYAPWRQQRVSGQTLQYSEWDVNVTPFDVNHGCVYSETVDVDYHLDWHTFGMKFSQEGITWYIDGTPVRTEYRFFKLKYVTIMNMNIPMYFPITDIQNFCNNNDNEQIYEQINLPTENIGMKVIIGNGHEAEGSFSNYNLTDFVSNYADWSEGFLEVDYFRFYNLTDCNKDLSFCNNNQFDNYYNNVKARNITLQSGCTINTPTLNHLNLVALDEIKILSEFNMGAASEFSAEIKNCVDGSIQRVQPQEIDSLAIISYYNDTTGYHSNGSRIKSPDHKTADANINIENNIKISPNPSKGQILINTFNTDQKTIKIINSLGKLIFENNFNDKDYSLNLNVASGIYYVEVKCGGSETHKKLIIEN